MHQKKDRGRMARLIALVLAGLMVFSALVSALMTIAYAGTENGKERTQYKISACMLVREQVVRCEQTTVYTNDTDGKLSQLFFSCYLNALRRESTLPFDSADLADAFAQGYAPGGIQFSAVLVDGEEAVWGVQGEDETFLRVQVDLEPGETATVTLCYDMLLCDCSGFAGTGTFDWRLTNAFPTLCPWKNGTFQTNGVLSTGRFAWAEPADWEMELTTPQGWEVVSGGTGAREERDGWTVWKIKMENARDLALVIGRRYTVYRSEKDARIAVYANDGAAARAAMQTAEEALALYEEWFGEYPWDTLAIVMSQYCLGAKSAPGVALLGKELFAAGQRDELEYRVTTMVAQQYFGEIVGVDPYEEPWLCESLSGMSAMLYYGQIYGEERMKAEMTKRVLPSLGVTIPGGVAADSPAEYFSSRSEYETMLYGRGVAAIYELRSAMGAEAFLGALGRYARENAFEEGRIERFVEACDGESSRSWGRYLTDMLANIGSDGSMQTDW